MRPQTAIKDVLLAQCSKDLGSSEIEAIERISLDSTETAIRSKEHLVDWETYNRGLQ